MWMDVLACQWHNSSAMNQQLGLHGQFAFAENEEYLDRNDAAREGSWCVDWPDSSLHSGLNARPTSWKTV